jgi:hypothetical protein
MDITPDFAALADQWPQGARELAAGIPYTSTQRWQHEAWGNLLKRHGWLTPDGPQATGQGTIATPAEVFAISAGRQSFREEITRMELHNPAHERCMQLMNKLIAAADKKGFALPFYLTETDTHGHVWVARVERRDDPHGFEATDLRTPPDGILVLPIIMTLKDAKGRTMRRTLTCHRSRNTEGQQGECI